MRGTQPTSTTRKAAVESDEDAPVCPHCGYLLIGLVSRTCPECGTPLADDLSIYRPSRRPPPWWSEWRLRFCGSPRRVTVGRAATFAAIVFVVSILLWPVVREGLLLCAVGSQWWARLTGITLGHLVELQRLEMVWIWQAGALARWWVLLGFLALALHGLSDRRVCQRVGLHARERLSRLLLMAPWFVLVEVLFFVGVWLDRPGIVPEPSTLFFCGTWTDCCTVWLRRVWLLRGVVPTLLIGAVYFRAVMCWRWPATIAGAVLFIPVALSLSAAWTLCYVEILKHL